MRGGASGASGHPRDEPFSQAVRPDQLAGAGLPARRRAAASAASAAPTSVADAGSGTTRKISPWPGEAAPEIDQVEIAGRVLGERSDERDRAHVGCEQLRPVLEVDEVGAVELARVRAVEA